MNTERVSKLKNKKPLLTCLSESIAWEAFRPLLDKGYSQEGRSNDEELESKVNDRRTFEEFVGLGVMNDINCHDCKNSICIDAENGFIRRFVVTPATIHAAYIWADSADSGECFKDLLSLAGFENRVHEKGSRNHPASAAAIERNSIRSQKE